MTARKTATSTARKTTSPAESRGVPTTPRVRAKVEKATAEQVVEAAAKVGLKPEEVGQPEGKTEAPKVAKPAEKKAETSKGHTAAGTDRKPASITEKAVVTPAKAKTAKVEVTDADRATLVFVASIQRKPSQRHLKGCSHFYPEGSDKDPKWTPATPEQLKALKPCPTCSHRAAKLRLAA